MDDAADVWKGEEQPAVRRRVRRRVEVPLDLASLEIDDHHVVGRQRRVVDAARLDREQGPRAIDRARIAEGEVDEAVPRQGEIGLVGFALEFLEHRLDSRPQARNPCAR